MKRFLSRRTVLRGLLGGTAVSIAMPPLEAMFNSTGTAYADGGTLPGRFGTWFWGNGMLPDRWIPDYFIQHSEKAPLLLGLSEAVISRARPRFGFVA